MLINSFRIHIALSCKHHTYIDTYKLCVAVARLMGSTTILHIDQRAVLLYIVLHVPNLAGILTLRC